MRRGRRLIPDFTRNPSPYRARRKYARGDSSKSTPFVSMRVGNHWESFCGRANSKTPPPRSSKRSFSNPDGLAPEVGWISGNFGAEKADSLIRVPFGLFNYAGHDVSRVFDHDTAQRNDGMRPA